MVVVSVVVPMVVAAALVRLAMVGVVVAHVALLVLSVGHSGFSYLNYEGNVDR